MAGRYSKDTKINLGTQLGTNVSIFLLRKSIKDGLIPIVSQVIATGDDRLDTLAGTLYGDARLWWVLAATSGIGWGMQIPPGTVVNVVKMSDVQKAFG